MSETTHYAGILVVVALAGLAAVLAGRLTHWLKVPVPALVLVAAALAAKFVPDLHHPDPHTVERIVTVALIVVLFDGGLHIGWRRFRPAAGAIATVGVLGTFLTAAATAVVIHLVVALSWYQSLLVATAVAPTDPAMVFAVLGPRRIVGRSSTILEGESGANDPVGIALLASLLSAGGLGGSAVGRVAGEFVLQMGVGALVGVAGGFALSWFSRRVSLPSPALYPLRTLAAVLLLYGVAGLAHGSGFLAVFVAGILMGDQGAPGRPEVPYDREVRGFLAALASLAEIVAFVVLGLTVDLDTLARRDVWLPGLAVAVVLTLIVRPVLVGACLLPARLRGPENWFVLLAGLKGAVPILLGVSIAAGAGAGADRLFGLVVVVVAFSVLVQASLVPTMVSRLGLAEPEPG